VASNLALYDPPSNGFRMAGDTLKGLLPFLSRTRVIAPLAAIGGGLSAFGDTNDTTTGNAIDAVGAAGGGVAGTLGAAALLNAAGAATPPAGPWGLALKGALLGAGAMAGSSLGQGALRGVADFVTGGATSNNPEDRLRQKLAKDVRMQGQLQREQATLNMPIRQAEALQAAAIQRQMDDIAAQRAASQGFINTTWANAAAQSARSSDATINAYLQALNA
jgi:hypothetical protein